MQTFMVQTHDCFLIKTCAVNTFALKLAPDFLYELVHNLEMFGSILFNIKLKFGLKKCKRTDYKIFAQVPENIRFYSSLLLATWPKIRKQLSFTNQASNQRP